MPEPVLYIRGFPGAGAFQPADPAMLSDLALIASLTEDPVTKLRARLQEARGFLDGETLRKLISNVIPDAKSAQAVFRALTNLESDDVESILKHVERARKAENKSNIDDAALESLRQNLATLILPYPALVRFEKAQRLATFTGQRLDSADLICDVRPIFDGEGREVEGMFPYTRLRVVATGADGLPRDFEAELSVEQVYRLYETVKRAKTKLQTLRSNIEKWMPQSIPNLSELRLPQGEKNA